MRSGLWVLTSAAVLLTACGSRQALTSEQAAKVQADVRAFTQIVAHDITAEGPSAWRKHFSDGPTFFMAAEGHMAFPNSEAATAGLKDVARAIKHIELKWGDDLRVDPLTPDLAAMATSWHEVQVDPAGKSVNEEGYFTGLTEYREGRWRFRNVHWSWPDSGPVVH